MRLIDLLTAKHPRFRVGMPVIFADRLVRRFYGDSQTFVGDLRLVKNWTPLAPQFFIETKAPVKVVGEDGSLVDWREYNGVEMWGALVEAFDLENPPLTDTAVKRLQALTDKLDETRKAETRWVEAFTLYSAQNNKVDGPVCTWVYFIRKDGSLVTGINAEGETTVPMHVIPHKLMQHWKAQRVTPSQAMIQQGASVANSWQTGMLPLYWTLAALHEPGLAVENHPPTPEKVVRARAKRGIHPTQGLHIMEDPTTAQPLAGLFEWDAEKYDLVPDLFAWAENRTLRVG